MTEPANPVDPVDPSREPEDEGRSQVQMIAVDKDDHDIRVDRWFKRHFPGVAHGRLEQYLRKGQVRVDGAKVKSNTRLETGQIVRVPPLVKMEAARPAHEIKQSDADRRFIQGMVIEELIRGLNCEGAAFDYFYYRTGAGAEVDLILEGDFGLIPVEIKYTQTVPPKQLRGINDFIKENKCPFGVVINNDETVRMYDENLIGIPFSHL